MSTDPSINQTIAYDEFSMKQRVAKYQAESPSGAAACSASFRVICPEHGEQDAKAFVLWAALVLRCGCTVQSVSDKWAWSHSQNAEASHGAKE